MAGEHGVRDGLLEGAPVLALAPGLQPLAHLGPEGVQGVDLVHRLGELVVQRREDLLLHLVDLDLRHSRLAAQRLRLVRVGEADVDRALPARVQADDGFLDLGHDTARADDEAIALLAARLHALRGERVVHEHEIARIRCALHRAELRVLLPQVLEGLVHLAVLEGLGGVLHAEPRVLPERDGGLDLDQGLELEGRILLQAHLLEIRLLHRLDLGLGEGLAVDLRDEAAGDFLPDLVGEVELDHARGHLALAEAGQARLFLDARESLLPRGADDLGAFFHLQLALAGTDLFDGDFHSGS